VRSVEAVSFDRWVLLGTKWGGTTVKTVEEFITGIGIVVIPILLVARVILRFTIHAAPLGMEELGILMAAWIFYVGSACTSRMREQITVTVIQLVPLNQRIRRVINVIALTISLMVNVAFFYICYGYLTWHESQPAILEPFGWPIVVLDLSLVTGIGLMTWHTLTHLVSEARGLARKTRTQGEG